MIRVLPRDAFNDANLLKCIGMLTLLIQDGMCHGLTFEYDGEPFDIQQDDGDGSTRVENITFITNGGRVFMPKRGCNSRDAYPLYFSFDDEEMYIFDDNGKLSEEFISFLQNN